MPRFMTFKHSKLAPPRSRIVNLEGRRIMAFGHSKLLSTGCAVCDADDTVGRMMRTARDDMVTLLEETGNVEGDEDQEDEMSSDEEVARTSAKPRRELKRTARDDVSKRLENMVTFLEENGNVEGDEDQEDEMSSDEEVARTSAKPRRGRGDGFAVRQHHVVDFVVPDDAEGEDEDDESHSKPRAPRGDVAWQLDFGSAHSRSAFLTPIALHISGAEVGRGVPPRFAKPDGWDSTLADAVAEYDGAPVPREETELADFVSRYVDVDAFASLMAYEMRTRLWIASKHSPRPMPRPDSIGFHQRLRRQTHHVCSECGETQLAHAASALSYSPPLSVLAKRCGLLAVSRILNDPFARAIAGEKAVASVCVDVASVWTRRGVRPAMHERESAGMRAVWLRAAVAEIERDQVVLLAPGLDTAGHALIGADVFEVDDDTTLSLKEYLIRTKTAHLRSKANSVTYIYESLLSSAWPAALLRTHFDTGKQTTWMLPDRVIEDFENEARERILRAPLLYSAPGSTLVLCFRPEFSFESPSARLKSLGYEDVTIVRTGVDDELGVVATTP
ncbi:hypothetical protein JKP88DRAFT_241241 [Tribonema minus]|uniref:Uncharacterized protein n=1 Tax=Tribonema minus TaxID=303371 RepID=A0A835YYA7_9STRA|nr:hypothetical protein JKP88DRAFT_241241 [Tribonema minus]